MKNLIWVFTILAIALMLFGCAGFAENTYKTEFVSGTAYNVGMSSISDLQKAGTVTAEVREKVNAVAWPFRRTWPVAVDALAAYKMAEGQNTQQAVNTAITQLFANWNDLAALINSIRPNTVPTSMMTLKGVPPSKELSNVQVKKLDSGMISIIVQVGAAVVQFVLPEIQRLMSVMSQKYVTLEEIQALKDLIKDPDKY